MKISITPKHIADARSAIPRGCPFDLAFRDALGLSAGEICVFGPTVRVGSVNCKVFLLPKEVEPRFMDWIRHGKIEPFDFEFDMSKEFEPFLESR
jgi:hypothetical protein